MPLIWRSGQCYAGTALYSHLGRPRHGLRYCRQRGSRSPQHDRGDQTGRASYHHRRRNGDRSHPALNALKALKMIKQLLTPSNWLYLLLIFIPIAIVLHWRQGPELWIFATSALAIVPLAGLMGKATEHLAAKLGEGIGGLLNATFGNAAELIIAIMAMRAGLFDVVKASITGSILGN